VPSRHRYRMSPGGLLLGGTVTGDLTVTGNVVISGTLTVTSTSAMSGNLDMQNNLILNIGAAGTDFITGGGLALAVGARLGVGVVASTNIVEIAGDGLGTTGGLFKTKGDIQLGASATFGGSLFFGSGGFNYATGDYIVQDAVGRIHILGGGSGAAAVQFVVNSGKVGIGVLSPAASSILDVTSTTLGFLPPRMTTAQRDAIGSPASGLVIYNTTTGKLNVRGAAAWEAITSA
jgi:hypothetical protein